MILPFASAASEGSANTIVAVHRNRLMNMARKLSLFIFLFASLGAAAQRPHEDWRTIETAHFRVHYPREYEQWSQRAASRLESIRTEVVKEIGFAPPHKIDVLVGNPIAQPNGAAFPLLDTPRIVFFA